MDPQLPLVLGEKNASINRTVLETSHRLWSRLALCLQAIKPKQGGYPVGSPLNAYQKSSRIHLVTIWKTVLRRRPAKIRVTSISITLHSNS